MVTKHLYSIEDVAATLMYSVQKGDAELSFKCAQELKCSGEEDYLLKLLTLCWITQEPGAGHYDSLIQKDTLSFLASLIQEKGYELPALSQRFPLTPPPNIETSETCPWQNIPKGWTQSQATILWKTNEKALKKGHWEKAYRLTCPLLPEDTDAVCAMLKAMNMEYMAYLLETTVFLPAAERVLKHAFYILRNKKKDKPKFKRDIFEKEGRTFHISPEALKLWHVKPKPESDLIGCPIIVSKDGASKYWRDMCEKFQITCSKKALKFKDDISLEKFYEECFPNDIPDEWLSAERNKSHGFKESLTDFVNPWFPAFIMLND